MDKDSFFLVLRYFNVKSFKALAETDWRIRAICIKYIQEVEPIYYFIAIGQMQGAFSDKREIEYLISRPNVRYYRAYCFYENASRSHFLRRWPLLHRLNEVANSHIEATMNILADEFFYDRKFHIPEWFYSSRDLKDRDILNRADTVCEFQNVEFGYAIKKLSDKKIILYHIASAIAFLFRKE